MADCIGIYFGGTTSCVAIHKDGKTDVVANDAGERTTSAAVNISSNETVVGSAAKQKGIRDPINTIMRVKHVVGRPFEDQVIQDLKKQSAFRIVESKGLAGYEVEPNNKKVIISSAQVTVHVFKKLKEIIEHQGGTDTKRAVLTVPVDFSNQQKDAIRRAAEAAGFEVLRVIGEPSAAVLAYDIGTTRPHDPCNVLVYRVGGSTVGVSVVHVSHGLQRVLASKTYAGCGGDDLTTDLTQSCAGDFKRQWKMDIKDSKRAMAKLYTGCENGKHVLSTVNRANINIDSLYEGVDFDSNLTRAKFESVINTSLQRCLQPISTILEENHLIPSDIQKVIVIGGTTRIPKLQSKLKDMFPEAEHLSSIPPDEVVALGAAIQAALLMSRDDNMSFSENELQTACTSKTLFIKVVNDDGVESLLPIIPQHTYIPLRQQQYFSIPPGQDSLCLQLVEGDSTATPGDTRNVGQVILRDLATEEPQEGKVTLDIHFKRDGTLEMTCSESVSGSMDSIVVSPMIKEIKDQGSAK